MNRSRAFAFHTGFDSGRNRYLIRPMASLRCIALAETAVDMSIQAEFPRHGTYQFDLFVRKNFANGLKLYR